VGAIHQFSRKDRTSPKCANPTPRKDLVTDFLFPDSSVLFGGGSQQNFTGRTPFVHDHTVRMRNTVLMTSATWMKTRPGSTRFVFWAPRLGGLAIATFLALFALDAVNAIHLVPSLLVLAIVAVGWKFEWVGAIGFTALAFLYAAMVWGRLDWVSVISTPLLLVGFLFCASWRARVVSHRA
jgi:hypothetical protein